VSKIYDSNLAIDSPRKPPIISGRHGARDIYWAAPASTLDSAKLLLSVSMTAASPHPPVPTHLPLCLRGPFRRRGRPRFSASRSAGKCQRSGGTAARVVGAARPQHSASGLKLLLYPRASRTRRRLRAGWSNLPRKSREPANVRARRPAARPPPRTA